MTTDDEQPRLPPTKNEPAAEDSPRDFDDPPADFTGYGSDVIAPKAHAIDSEYVVATIYASDYPDGEYLASDVFVDLDGSDDVTNVDLQPTEPGEYGNTDESDLGQ